MCNLSPVHLPGFDLPIFMVGGPTLWWPLWVMAEAGGNHRRILKPEGPKDYIIAIVSKLETLGIYDIYIYIYIYMLYFISPAIWNMNFIWNLGLSESERWELDWGNYPQARDRNLSGWWHVTWFMKIRVSLHGFSHKWWEFLQWSVQQARIVCKEMLAAKAVSITIGLAKPIKRSRAGRRNSGWCC